MGKRSRDASFSPDLAEASSPSDASIGACHDELDSSLRPGKVTALDSASTPVGGRMQCSLPPHREASIFATIDEYELHYAKEHSNRCSSCGKNFPSAQFLSLHIDEHHNPLREAAQAQGEKTYACFVEGCDRKCSTPQKRRLHLIDKHMFPKVYNFRVVDNGIDRSTSMLKEGQRRRVSVSNDHKNTGAHRRPAGTGLSSLQDVHNTAKAHQNGVRHGSIKEGTAISGDSPDISTQSTESTGSSTEPSDVSVAELEMSMSALRFVPPSVMLRQGKKKVNGC